MYWKDAAEAWEKADLRPRETHQLNSLVTLLSTGSPLSPESFGGAAAAAPPPR